MGLWEWVQSVKSFFYMAWPSRGHPVLSNLNTQEYKMDGPNWHHLAFVISHHSTTIVAIGMEKSWWEGHWLCVGPTTWARTHQSWTNYLNNNPIYQLPGAMLRPHYSITHCRQQPLIWWDVDYMDPSHPIMAVTYLDLNWYIFWVRSCLSCLWHFVLHYLRI